MGMKKSADPVTTQEVTVDLLEICPSCGRSDVLRVNLIVGWDICKPSHRWCSGYGCSYTKDLLNG